MFKDIRKVIMSKRMQTLSREVENIKKTDGNLRNEKEQYLK